MNTTKRFPKNGMRRWQSLVTIFLLPIVIAVGAGVPFVSIAKKEAKKC